MGSARGNHRPDDSETSPTHRHNFLLRPGEDLSRGCGRSAPTGAGLVSKATGRDAPSSCERIGCSRNDCDLSHVAELCSLSRSGMALGDRESQGNSASDSARRGDEATRANCSSVIGSYGSGDLALASVCPESVGSESGHGCALEIGESASGLSRFPAVLN